ncbi:hypothetical protein [Opitutus sp. ER46]|uniref:hypothetical protein n=1 Tax=Opitutus sp. ER46 TaxID=2161864 RepID=UPI0011B1FBD9|nr:hypothetical protein [Opitutus sp. ER46]
MTSEERSLCRGLVITPPGAGRKISKEEFASRLPSAVERGAVATRLLEEALQSKNSEDVQCVLIVGHAFGFAADQVGVLSRLLEADWHVSHEDVVSALDKLRSPAAVSALVRATEWIPEYLNYDDSRALAGKAIWALGKVPGGEAESALRKLAASNESVIRDAALQQLERRKA